jgi:hypothetical protein
MKHTIKLGNILVQDQTTLHGIKFKCLRAGCLIKMSDNENILTRDKLTKTLIKLIKPKLTV